MNVKIIKIFIFLCSACSNLIFSQEYINRTEAKEDLNFLFKTLENVHYNPYLNISSERVIAARNNFTNSISDSINIKDFYFQLNCITALLGDSHISVQPSNVMVDELFNAEFFPIVIDKQNDKVIVRKIYGENLGVSIDDEIVTINGFSVDSLYRLFNKEIAGFDSSRYDVTNKMFNAKLFLKNINAPFKIEYRKKSSRQNNLAIIKGIPVGSFFDKKEPYRYKIIGNNIAYVDLVSMNDKYRFSVFLDSVFSDIQSKMVNNLIIDLRNNSGENSLFGEILLNYITNKPYKIKCGRYWRISNEYKNYLLSNKDSSKNADLYLKMSNGSLFYTPDTNFKYPSQNNLKFNGKVCFLIGNKTFSSASMLADAVSSYKLATLIGEPTGDAPNTFSEVFYFYLPKSRLRIQCSTALDVRANCIATNMKPVMPDVYIKQSKENDGIVIRRAIEWFKNSK